MKNFFFFVLLLSCFSLFSDQNKLEADQFQWGMKNYLMILQKGMDQCEEKGYSYFKVEQYFIKSSDGKELSFKDTIRDTSGHPYKESTSMYSATFYLYNEKPFDTSYVDVKKHIALKNLATGISPAPISEVFEGIKLLQEIQDSPTSVYVKFYTKNCAPCEYLSHLFQKLANENTEEGKYLSVDLDKNDELREFYQITARPTLLVFSKRGELTARCVGLADIAQYIDTKLSEPKTPHALCNYSN